MGLFHRNVEEWRKLGYDVRHVPIGYTPNLTRIPKATTQDWDVCFFGWMTPRRVAIIEQLRAAGLKVFASAACYGGGRDNIISRSKICLNVHHDGRDMFEIVRVSYMMANAKRVVSEESVDDQDYFGLAVERVNYRALVDFCKNAVWTSPDPKFEKLSLDSIRRNDFTQSVAQALERGDAIEGTKSHVTITVTGDSPSGKREGDWPITDTMRRHSIEWAGTGDTPNGQAYIRYCKGKEQGDMKDFLPWMREHAKGNVMEIGVRDGASTSAFLLGVEEHGGHVYSVDVQNCSHLFKGHPQWTFIQSNSTNFQEVIKQIPFELDLILVDGDHSRAGVISDFQYARQLRPGGIVLFHDIAPEEKPSDCNDCSWPGDDAKNVFEELSAALAPLGWKKEILPGKYGMGVLRKPVLVAA